MRLNLLQVAGGYKMALTLHFMIHLNGYYRWLLKQGREA